MGKKSFVSIADTYFDRFPSSDINLGSLANQKLKLIVVIPSYDEPQLISSINSLLNAANHVEIVIEVIVVVNHSKLSENKVISQNLKCIKELKDIPKCDNLNVHCIYCPDMDPKHAGVGWARKIGMDQALRRFKAINFDGLICCFDADSKVDANYFSSLWETFEKESFNGASIHFEHPLFGDEFDSSIYKEIALYETHLRYYKNALSFCGFPYAFHTVGSSMVVKASAYAKQGGMNRRKAGEDFYFINKIIALGNYSEIFSTKVIPSPRISDRVPFGTGRAIKESLEGDKDLSKTYDFEIFRIIKSWVNQVIYENTYHYFLFSTEMKSFISEDQWEMKLGQLKKNTSSITSFRHRFFQVFDAFWTLKCVHFLRDNYFSDSDLLTNSNKLFDELEIDKALNIDIAISSFRNLDKKIGDLNGPLK